MQYMILSNYSRRILRGGNIDYILYRCICYPSFCYVRPKVCFEPWKPGKIYGKQWGKSGGAAPPLALRDHIGAARDAES